MMRWYTYSGSAVRCKTAQISPWIKKIPENWELLFTPEAHVVCIMVEFERPPLQLAADWLWHSVRILLNSFHSDILALMVPICSPFRYRTSCKQICVGFSVDQENSQKLGIIVHARSTCSSIIAEFEHRPLKLAADWLQHSSIKCTVRQPNRQQIASTADSAHRTGLVIEW